MSDIRTNRPYQERFLDGYDRSQLRAEVQKVKPVRFAGMKKKYATWALGASLAIGGLGAPMKMIQSQQDRSGAGAQESRTSAGADTGIETDLREAASIASQVAGGVKAVAGGVAAATTAPLQTVAEAPKALAVISDGMKEQFFKKEIPFGGLIYQEAKKNNVAPELVAAVAHTESKFNPNARSHAGAVGLMQLVPRTGRWMGARDLRNPAQNVAAGAKYLAYLNDRFNGDQQKVLAAYNAGEGNVRRFGGVPPFRETRQYLARVKSYQQDLDARIDGHLAAQQELAQ